MRPAPPATHGRIIVQDGDLAALKFWIRVFELDGYVALAQAQITNQAKAKWGAVPIINEYQCGKLRWCYVLTLDIDSLGLAGGIGIIYYADEAHWEQVRESRDKLADNVMKTVRQRTDSGQMLTEMALIPPGKETL
jgi:hypothetical protein